MKERGFTLIELLVVIAIIGILSSIVLASLNTARNKSKNASVKSELSSMRGEAELLADGGSYATVCTNQATGPNPKKLYNAAVAVAGAVDGTSARCNAAASAWAAVVALPVAEGSTGTLTHWCVDSTGVSKGITALLASGNTTCD